MEKTAALFLRTKTKDHLDKMLIEFKKTLSRLNMKKHTGGGTNKLWQIRMVRENIARVLTVIRLNQHEQVKKFYLKKKRTPIDLKPRLTLAERRELNPYTHD
jgi:large subunit ribosomal protein L35e